MKPAPTAAACEPALDADRALILGKATPQIGAIGRALAAYFGEVSVANALPPVDHRRNFGLIVVTDAIEPAPDREFVYNLRRDYPRAKVLGIFDQFDPEIEIVMRSAGIVFWGSHERFSTLCEKILQTVLPDRVTAKTA